MAFLYTLASDELTSKVASYWTYGTQYPAYPASNAKLLDPSMPVKLDVGSSLVADAGAVFGGTDDHPRAGFVALIGHTLRYGAQVFFEMSDDPTFTPVTSSHPLVIASNPSPGGMPVNPWRAFSYGSAQGRYWRIRVQSQGSPATATVMLGAVWFSGWEPSRLARGVSWGSSRTRTRLGVIHRTQGGARLGYDYGLTLRKLSGSTIASFAEDYGGERNSLEWWWDASRGALRPFVIVPDDLARDAMSGAWLVTWDSMTHTHTRGVGAQATFPLAFEEVPQGVWVVP